MSDAGLTDTTHKQLDKFPESGASAEAAGRTQFLSDLNYDLRTPLAGIMGMLDLLAETPLTVEQRQYLTMTRECAEALRATIENSLADTGRTWRPAMADLFLPQDLLAKVFQRFLKVGEGRKVAMQLHQDANSTLAALLPADADPAQSMAARGDFVLMEQLLDNVFSRLLNDFPNGMLKVESRLQRVSALPNPAGVGNPAPTGYAALLQGIGEVQGISEAQATGNAAQTGGQGPKPVRWIISIQTVSRILEGSEAHASADFRMAERLMETLEGQLLADQLGRSGLLVTLSIPLDIAEISGPGALSGANSLAGQQFSAPTPVSPVPSTVFPPGNGARLDGPFSGPSPASRFAVGASAEAAPSILLVEDNLVAQKYLSTLLSRRGFVVHVADSGEAALALFFGQTNAATRFDLVLMDIQMPGMDGIETTRRIRQLLNGLHADANKLPIVACTANPTEEIRRAAEQAGMTAFLSKPIRPAELVQTIEKLRRRPEAKAPGFESSFTVPVQAGTERMMG